MTADIRTDASAVPDHSIIDTLQSLIVAFVLAMTFRGFVTEGFVIPTGSMAPTLLGRHKHLHSMQTGYEFDAGADARIQQLRTDEVPDPMLGPGYPGTAGTGHRRGARMGDRILVLKALYQFCDPARYDVVVFKNPTNPNGEDGNYIKRLIGLPGESIWLVDGDVFAGSADAPHDYGAYRVQRKPEYIQRAVWQPVHSSDYRPLHPEDLDAFWPGSPWQGDHWDTTKSVYACPTADPTRLEWDAHVRSIDDWTPYNLLMPRARRGDVPVSDLRVAAAVVPDRQGLEITFRLDARGHEMEYRIAGGTAQLRMRSSAWGEEYPEEGWEGPPPVAVDPLPPGRPTDVDFWHVDQAMVLFIDGHRVARYEYEWTPVQRLEYTTHRTGTPEELAESGPASGPDLSWSFRGSPLRLYRVRVDRDLYYRTDRLDRRQAEKNPTHRQFQREVADGQYAFGTNPGNLAILGPDQFMMAGDNSPASSDSRLWGSPHPLVAEQIDPSPFLVNRKLLLGKAWVVYFPAPHALTSTRRAFIPDFGRLRFIR